MPSHDTFSRVFRLLDPVTFETCFARYVAALGERIACSDEGGVVAVDGKTARQSFDRRGGQGPLHLISAFACATRLALGQRKVDGKSNEISALPELLALLTLDGCSLVGCGVPTAPHGVTADAMHCQKATAEAILDRGGDYVLAVKGNQKTLFEDIQLLLDDPDAAPDDTAETVDGDHGRIETRRAKVLHDVAGSPSGTVSPASGRSARSRPRARSTARRRPPAAITSSPNRSPPRASSTSSAPTGTSRTACTGFSLDLFRGVVISEDQSRARKDNGPENLARLRRFALDIIRANQDKGSTRGKLERAA